jgi:hypothetical protein
MDGWTRVVSTQIDVFLMVLMAFAGPALVEVNSARPGWLVAADGSGVHSRP